MVETSSNNFSRAADRSVDFVSVSTLLISIVSIGILIWTMTNRCRFLSRSGRFLPTASQAARRYPELSCQSLACSRNCEPHHGNDLPQEKALDCYSSMTTIGCES